MRGVNVSALSLKSCTACLGYTQKEIICATTNPAYFLTSAHLASPCEVVVDTGKVWGRGGLRILQSMVYGPDSNISRTILWIYIKCGTDIHGAKRIYPMTYVIP